jgi:hypothetical protein
METVLNFFADLMLITGGIVVLAFWIVLFVLIGIEIWDAFHEKPEEEEEDR